MRKTLVLSLLLHLAFGVALLVYQHVGRRPTHSDSNTVLDLDLDVLNIAEQSRRGDNRAESAHSKSVKKASQVAEQAPAPQTPDTPALDSAAATVPASNTPAAASSEDQITIDGEGGTGPRVLSNVDYVKWVRGHNRAPEYPPVARMRDEKGRVVIKVMVARRGSPPESVELEQGSGFSLLDQAAMDVVKTWNFPAFKSTQEKILLRVGFKFGLTAN